MSVSPLLMLSLYGCDGNTVVVNDKVDTADYSGLDSETGDSAVLASPDIEVTPTALDFGTIPVGVATTQTFNIANLGDSPLTIGAVVTTGATPFSLNTGGAYIMPGASNDIIVTFVADTIATYSGAVSVTSDDPDEPEIIVALSGSAGADSDGDGYLDDEDCEPDDPAAYPGGTEIYYDGIDGNCDGLSDYDQDGDGYDDAAYGGDDCNDLDAAINPAATEIWYDGIDGNCDNRSDYDQDGDGYDSVDYGGDDCNDTDAAVSPGTLEVQDNAIDDDCDGNIDEPLSTEDLDHDGYSEVDGDCNDGDPAINPAATEVWYDGLDQNCDGLSDYDQDADGYESSDFGGSDCADTDATINPSASQVWYDGIDEDCDGWSDYDQDRDGHDDVAYGGDDCDDLDAAINPDASEVWYDSVDQNCDGASDYDQDADGFDSSDYGGADCNDLDATYYPGATEVYYDGMDQNCDGASDYDADGDGYDSAMYGGDDCFDADPTINPAASETWYDGVDSNCDGASDFDADSDGYDSSVWGGDDCNDADSSINPSASEICDGIDDDCDGVADNGVTTTYYADSDGDSYGDPRATTEACSVPTGYVENSGDCDDTEPAAWTGATEVCDGVDNDCDGSTDEGVKTTYYADSDADGYGNLTVTSAACSAPTGYVADSTDCNDSASTTHPAAAELCDAVDNDCDGSIDEGATTAFYADTDGDGYGNLASSTNACSAPTGYVANSTDCDDTTSSANPAATEVCDSIDNDCDGSIDEGVKTTYYLDGDGDGYGTSSTTRNACSLPSGYSSLSTDCNDATASISPAATEVCDGIDNDCDGTIDDGTGSTVYYRDADSDGYGDASVTTTACSTAPTGYVSDSTDCDDTDATSNPGAAEASYDAADNDCDGIQDDMVAEDETAWTITGNDASDYVGRGSVLVSPDLDGDGKTELVSGDSYYHGGYGYTRIGHVGFHDRDTKANPADAETAYLDHYGDSAYDQFGATVIAANIDSDSYTELAVGAPYDNTSASYAGSIYIYDVYGWSGYAYASYYADGEVDGTSENGHYGSASAFGDMDGDGGVDLAGGAPGASSSRGRLYVTLYDDGYYDNTIEAGDGSYYVRGVSDYDYLGTATAFGDFNDDGYDDLVMCSPGDDDGGSAAGTCWIDNGSSAPSAADTTVSSVYNTVITGPAASANLGGTSQSVAVGDFDNDGVDDLAVGVYGYSSVASLAGAVAIWEGASLSGSETLTSADWLVRGSTSADEVGYSVQFGDLTGDGIADLLTGAPLAGTLGEGVLYLIEGAQAHGTYDVPNDQYASWSGPSAGSYFGYTIGSGADLDADGTDDFAVSAPYADKSATDGGEVYVLSGY